MNRLGRRDCPSMDGADLIRSSGSARHVVIDDVHAGMNSATLTSRGFSLAKIR